MISEKLLRHRKNLIIGAHLVLFIAAYVLSYELRFDFSIPPLHFDLMIFSLAPVLAVKLYIFWRFNLYQGWWRYVGTGDLALILKASLVCGVAVMACGYLFFQAYGFPRSIPFLDFGLTVCLIGGSRFAIRTLREARFFQPSLRGLGGRRRVLIIGAGNSGETLAREIHKYPAMNYEIVGFLDDSPYKQGARIHGHRVLGPVAEVEETCLRCGAEEILIAMPSATGRQMKRIVELCKATSLKIRTIPGLDQLIDGRVTANQLRDVQIEDLLGREPVILDREMIGDCLRGRRVLVTGAAGSIGSEICRQVLVFGPRELVLVDRWENGIFAMKNELRSPPGGAPIRCFIGDIADRGRLTDIFQRTRPEVVFHAAAYKHVPIMEENPSEAVKNNVAGTLALAEACEEAGTVERCVMISTDKAVNPTSIMGATKRIAERCVQRRAAGLGVKFITVRFGNVLASAGSVIPTFKEQIARGGPVTVTHPEMTRYFMTISEASQLVLQAGSMGRGGEIFLLDMGEPVNILEMAETLIRLSGLKPHDDIEIEITGVRPGEKLFEELNLDEELISRTTHPKVMALKASDNRQADFQDKLARLIEIAREGDDRAVIGSLSALVPEYRAPEHWFPERRGPEEAPRAAKTGSQANQKSAAKPSPALSGPAPVKPKIVTH